ncbi:MULTISPECIES: hypothetical protein [unclassified Streptomyces]
MRKALKKAVVVGAGVLVLSGVAAALTHGRPVNGRGRKPGVGGRGMNTR